MVVARNDLAPSTVVKWAQRPPLLAKIPHGRRRTMTFLAALRHDGLTEPSVIDGPINGESLRADVEQVLAAALGHRGEIDEAPAVGPELMAMKPDFRLAPRFARF